MHSHEMAPLQLPKCTQCTAQHQQQAQQCVQGTYCGGWRRCACLDAKTRVLAVGVLAVAHTPPGREGGCCCCGGGAGGAARPVASGGQGRVQGRQHSDVSSTARLPVSTRTLRGCLTAEGQLNK
jgi:hypothetical protein